MELNPELFVIPENSNSFFLYVPLQGSVLKVNSALVLQLQKFRAHRDISKLDEKVVKELTMHHILVGDKVAEGQSDGNKSQAEEKYKPTSVTLMPTFNCNLRCIYCYATSGENTGSDLEWNVAKAAVDLVLANCEEKGSKSASLGFHGGGEPLLNNQMELVKRIVEYFRQNAEHRGLKHSVNSVTNGVTSQKNIEWLVNNFDRLNISIDGPEDIQNRQRPMAGGQPSFSKVMATIEYLEAKHFNYGMRATITDESVYRMPEIVEFFHAISSTKQFHLEPLFECGRCATTSAKAPKPEDFLTYMVEARKVAGKFGIDVPYSADRLNSNSTYFCGAAGKNFFVNPHGFVTTCLEACREDDELAEVFGIGHFDSAKGLFIFDNYKLSRLMERTVENMPYCSDCFAKYSCAGDCLAKVYVQSGSLINPENNQRCIINRGLLLDEMRTKTLKMEVV